MSVNNLTPKVRSKAKKVLNLAVRSKRSMKLNELNFVRTSTFIGKEAKRISNPGIDKRKLKKLINTDFYAIGSASLGGGGGGGLLGLLGDLLGFGGGGGRGRGGRGGRRGGPPSRRAQQRYRRRFGNRAGNRRFGRMPQFGRGGGVRIPRAGGVLGVAMAGLEYGGRVSEGQTQTQAITGTAASTAGGIAGAYAGAKGGALLGAGIGALFGGVGAVPGAAIGGFLGGIAGGFGGSMLAGGAADRLTGVVGKDKASEEADKELAEETKVNPLGLTLDKFDQVVDRFAKLIPTINIAKEDEIELPEMLSFSGRNIPFSVQPQAQEALRKYEETGEKQVVQTEQGLIQVGPTAGNRLGIFGGPDLTPKLSYNPALTPESYEITARQLAAAQLFFNLPATLSPLAAKGKSAQPRVVTPVTRNPVTRSGVPQGPAVPPTTSRPATTTPPVVRTPRVIKKKMKPEEMPVAGPAENIFQSQTPRQVRQPELRREQVRSGSTPSAVRAQRDAEGAMRGGEAESTALSQVRQASKKQSIEDAKNLDFAKQLMGRSPKERPMGRTVVQYDDGPVEFSMPKGAMPRITPEEYIFKRLQKEYPGLDPNKLIEGKVDFSGGLSDASGINQYTTYNAPNNTTIIMQQGGDQMPPQSSPPQMVASAPPPMISAGPSSYDVALKMHGIFQLNNLQTT
jgi:hypothetical protein|tara:strand:- start:1331 stop:3373 length:2043 start_codon:yes stop_codon:yes gene_type:complete